MNQVTQLKSYLQVNKSISQLEAGKVLGIDRLASRVHDLKKTGSIVNRTFCKDFHGKRYVRYSLVV